MAYVTVIVDGHAADIEVDLSGTDRGQDFLAAGSGIVDEHDGSLKMSR